MIIKPDGTVRSLTEREHIHYKNIVYQDSQHTIHLTTNKRQPFLITDGKGQDVYIDLFGLHFGQKERLNRRTVHGLEPMCYKCSRRERDKILFTPVDEVVEEPLLHHCEEGCQYYSRPVGIKGRYAFNCVLVKYRALRYFDLKSGLTLEEVGRIYGCSRERIRQIEEQAMRKLRHHSRIRHFQALHQRVLDYRDYRPQMFQLTA